MVIVEDRYMKEKGKKKEYPSLYDAFKLGQRVMRTYEDKYGKKVMYEGIVLAIDKNGLEIYWDTLNGQYKPKEIDTSFTHCDEEEVFCGREKYGPIKKDKYYS